MAETRFTPGPWEWDWENGWLVHKENEDDGLIVLAPDTDRAKIEVYTTDAALIAAAPELYAACAAFVEAWEKSLQLEKTDVALRLARAALAKAAPGDSVD